MRAVYDSMKDEAGNLHYITFDELALSMDSQVDGVHATDLGMQQYADAYYKKITGILFPGAGDFILYTRQIAPRFFHIPVDKAA